MTEDSSMLKLVVILLKFQSQATIYGAWFDIIRAKFSILYLNSKDLISLFCMAFKLF